MRPADLDPNGVIVARRRKLYWVRLIVAVALIASLIWLAGPGNLLRTFTSMNPVLVLACALAIIAFFLLGSVNVWWLLRCRNAIAYKVYLRSYAYGFSIGLLSPGQIGDVTLVLFLRNGGVPIRTSGAAYAVDKLISLSVLSLVAAFGLQRYGLVGIWQLVALGAVLIGIVVLSGFLVGYAFPDNRLCRIVRTVFTDIADYRFHLGAVFGNVLLTAIKWLVLCTAYYLAFLAFDTDTSWPDIGVVPAISTLVGYIPISIGGIGTVEVSAVMLFKRLGYAEEIVISVYILLRSLQYLLALSLMGFLRDNAVRRTS